VDYQFSRQVNNVIPYPLRELKNAISGMELIFLSSSSHSPDATPKEQFLNILENLLSKRPEDILMTVKHELEETAMEIMLNRGIESSREEVTVINNSQRGLELVGRVLLDPEQTVIIEKPCHSGAIVCYKSLGANIIEVPVDKDGLNTDVLEELLQQLSGNAYKAKLLYTMPNFQNPTGYLMSLERRKKLVELADQYNFVIFENDMFGEMDFRPPDTRKLPTLASLSPDRVVYLSTYAGLVIPGLRTSYLKGPAEIIKNVEYLGESADIFAGSIEHRLIIEMVNSGELQKGMLEAQHLYKNQRLAMLAALDEFMPEDVEWSKPKGGFYVWVTLPEKYKTVGVLNKAVQQGMSFAPGIVFNKDEREDNALRLSFSAETPARIKSGVAFLGNAIRFWDIKEKVPWALGDFCSRCNNISGRDV